MASAVVITENNEFDGVKAEYRWLDNHYPNYQRGNQAVLDQGGRMYDRIELTTASGEKKVVYFDITGFFGKM